jgi:hypothetical protein
MEWVTDVNITNKYAHIVFVVEDPLFLNQLLKKCIKKFFNFLILKKIKGNYYFLILKIKGIIFLIF